MTIEIKTAITIKLPGVEKLVELTREEASELTDALLDQFPEKRQSVIQFPSTPTGSDHFKPWPIDTTKIWSGVPGIEPEAEEGFNSRPLCVIDFPFNQKRIVGYRYKREITFGTPGYYDRPIPIYRDEESEVE